MRAQFVLAFLLCSRLGLAQTAASPPPAPPPPAPPPSAFHVSGYGLVIANAEYVLGGVNNLDVAQWATAGNNEFAFAIRQSRFGLKGTWVKPPSALHANEIGALIEADFFGGFFGQGLAYYFPIPRLRIAKAYIQWPWVRFSFGQDWSVLAPLNPDSSLHFGVPGFAASGNLWARMPQMRVDGVFGKSWRLVWALALVAEVQADGIASVDNAFTGIRKPEGGENALAPAGEGRVAVAHDLFGRTLELGLSGHIGKRTLAYTGGTIDKNNGALALDVTIPLGHMLGLKGEVYWGKGLDAFFGGIQQGFGFTSDPMNTTTLNITGIGKGIRDVGGWAQLTFTPLSWLTLLAGGGADEPTVEDMIPAKAATNRTLNAAFYGSVNFELAKGFALWLEYNFLHTEYQASPTRESQVVALSGVLAF
jgi:hypothetical protein